MKKSIVLLLVLAAPALADITNNLQVVFTPTQNQLLIVANNSDNDSRTNGYAPYTGTNNPPLTLQDYKESLAQSALVTASQGVAGRRMDTMIQAFSTNSVAKQSLVLKILNP